VPTPSLVAWLLAAAEFDLPLDDLPRRDPRLVQRQHESLLIAPDMR
jgi:hypothetical protein